MTIANRILRADKADLGVGAAIGVLIVAILATIAGGDRVGIGISDHTPDTEAHTTSPIRATFDEPMDTASVETAFTINPPVPGKFSWNGSQLTYLPTRAFEAGQDYTVTIRAGAKSSLGRSVISDIHWSFHVVSPRVVFLAPAMADQGGAPANLYLVDPSKPMTATRLTKSPVGVADFRASPDGTQIAYTQQNVDGTSDIFLIPSGGGKAQQITNCVKAQCQAPDWSPDGLRIVYERTELNPALPVTDRGVPRAWIVSLTDLSSTPLFSDTQSLGHLPRWSPDGTQISLYDKNLHSIGVYDLVTGTGKVIQTAVEDSGIFDPTSSRLLYSQLVQTPEAFYNAFYLADLSNPQNGVKPLNGDDASAVDDRQASWMPDGKSVAVTRTYVNNPGQCSPQIYLVDLQTLKAQPLTTDTTYTDGAISWDPAGEQLVMQRWQCKVDGATPGIWVYDAKTKAIQQIATNGFLPQWVP